MLHTAFLSDNVRRCNVSVVVSMVLASERLLIKAALFGKAELYLDKPGSEERSIACSDIHRLCYDLGPKPS